MIKEKVDLPNRPHWVSEMDKTVGQTGKITEVIDAGVAVKTDIAGSWWYAREALLPVNDFEVGMKVKVVKVIRSDDAPVWVPAMDKTVGEVCEVVEIRRYKNDRIKLQTTQGQWWYSIASVEAAETRPTIVTEKVMRGGKKCRRIVSFKNFPTHSSWNGKIGVGPYYYINASYSGMGSRHNVNSEGTPFWDIHGAGNEYVVFKFEDEKTDIRINTCCLVIGNETVFLEGTFQAIVKQFKICQARLEKINACEEQWSGIEEVVI